MDPVIISSTICITLFSLFGTFSLLSTTGNSTANKILGAFFLLWSLDFLDGMLLLKGYYFDHPNFALWGDSIVFLYGPLLYLYTLHVTDSESKGNPRTALHFLPFAVYLFLIAIFFHRLPESSKSEFLSDMLSNYTPFRAAPMILLVYAQITTYIILSKRQVRKTRADLDNFYSHHDLEWLNHLLNAFLIILSLSLVTDILHFFSTVSYLNVALPITIMIVGLVTAGIIIKAMNKPLPTNPHSSMAKSPDMDLSDSETNEIAELIQEIFEKEKPFLDPEFNLDDLSNRVGQNRRLVSKVINSRLNRNFFDLVNGYRIEEAKEILTANEDPKLTVLEVMFDVGFSSKSSFNTQFKKRTGITPSEFMNLS